MITKHLTMSRNNLIINQILTVALASYFFEKFPLPVRISICIIGVILLILGFLMQPSEKGV